MRALDQERAAHVAGAPFAAAIRFRGGSAAQQLSGQRRKVGALEEEVAEALRASNDRGQAAAQLRNSLQAVVVAEEQLEDLRRASHAERGELRGAVGEARPHEAAPNSGRG